MTSARDPLPVERKAENEHLFRTVNERTERAVARAGAMSAQRFTMLCECADPECIAMVELSIEDYEDVRSAGNRFLVRPGHQAADDGQEEVVRRALGYEIVEKRGRERELTAALDERDRAVDFGERSDRVARNEAIYREVNDRIVGSATPLAGADDHVDIACECGNLTCAELLRVRLTDYRRVREVPTRFMVTRGHVVPDTEVVVERRGG
ncbi:MAG: hypothetical protein JWM86_1766, partial [Thermoleophilia bacterium]|nr:hypothetical protein [Thermoleophilia bacterium]